MKRALAHSRASCGRLRRSTSSHKCTALARQYLLCNREFPGISCKKGDTRRYLHFYSFSSAASYVGMIQIRYTGLSDTANSQPDPSGSPVCLFSFLTRFTIYFPSGKVKFAPGFVHDFKTADFAWIHRYFSCIPCSLLTALCSPPIAFSRRPFRNFLSCLFSPPVLQSKSVNGMQHEGERPGAAVNSIT